MIVTLVLAFIRIGSDTPISIFSDISECQSLSADFNGEVVVYSTTDSDKHLKNLKYIDFYCAEFDSDEIEFEIYAYNFDSTEVAEQYYENYYGSKCAINPIFKETGNPLSASMIVVDGCNVYTVYANPFKIESVKDFLADNFSKYPFEDQSSN